MNRYLIIEVLMCLVIEFMCVSSSRLSCVASSKVWYFSSSKCRCLIEDWTYPEKSTCICIAAGTSVSRKIRIIALRLRTVRFTSGTRFRNPNFTRPVQCVKPRMEALRHKTGHFLGKIRNLDGVFRWDRNGFWGTTDRSVLLGVGGPGTYWAHC